MAFRIRKTDVNYDDLDQFQKEWETNVKIYREHLEKLAKNKDHTLWKYFYWDAFHDGEIKNVSFWDTPGDITLHISCPNIKKRKGDSFDFVAPIDFECHFKSVVYFHFEHNNPDDLIYKQQRPFEFLFSEIDTLTEFIEKNKTFDEDGDVENEFHSIILELRGHDELFYVELVFNYLEVVPKEPIAYELMLASDEFYVPIYREGEVPDKLPAWISNPSGEKLIQDDDED